MFYEKKNKLILPIEDNGKGFDQTIKKTGNGIANMKKRAEQLKGSFLIESEIGKGTKIIFKVLV